MVLINVTPITNAQHLVPMETSVPQEKAVLITPHALLMWFHRRMILPTVGQARKMQSVLAGSRVEMTTIVVMIKRVIVALLNARHQIFKVASISFVVLVSISSVSFSLLMREINSSLSL